MKRKRFVKIMMAHGIDRNTVNHLAEFGRSMEMSYFNVLLPFFSMDREEEPVVLEHGKSFAFDVDEPNHEDSWVDMAGYAACGAELACRGGAV